MNTNTTLPPGSPLRPQEEEINLFEYAAIIMRRWKTFAAALLAVFILVALYTFTMKPVYEAAAMLHIKEQKGGMLFADPMFSHTIPINAEIEILKSRTSSEKVVQRLHLNREISDVSRNFTFNILEFTSTAEEPVYKIRLTSPDTYEVRHNGGKIIGEGKNGVLFKHNGLSLLIKDIKGKKGDNFEAALLPFDTKVEALRKGIKAVELGRQTSIIRASYEHNDPVLARDIVNALVQAYLDQSVGFKTEEASQTVSFIEEQINLLSKELNTSEQDLQIYKSNTGIVQLDSEAQALIGKISDMEKNRADIMLQRQQIEFARDALRQAKQKGEIYSPGVMKNDPLVAGLAAKLSELEVQKKALLTDYTEAHQGVKSVKNQIDEIQNKILAIYDTSRFNLAKQEEAVINQLKIYESQMRRLPDVERDLARLTRLSKVNADIYTFLLQKHEETRIARASTISNINIVDPAIIPNRPIKPKKAQNLLLGLIFGMALGIGLVFFQEYLDDTIKNAEEAKRATGLPLLAVIPHISSSQPELNGSAPDKDTLVTKTEPKSMAAEAFRSLRTNLHFTAINKEKKIMLFTSTFAQEGKSTITANEAVVISQTGAKVLIVDCDLRRSSLHEKFGHSKTPGLTEILTGDVTFDKAKHNTGIPNLDLITAGTTPPNPSELLGSEAMQQLLITQRDQYDYILIDAPPALTVTDAPVLATISDIVIFIIEAGRVPIKAAQHVRETLAALQISIGGIIINDKTGKGETYGYYGNRYGYGYYSDEPPLPSAQKRWGKTLRDTWKRILKKP